MQLVWSKILAGEIEQPKKFSLHTLETIRNVSKSEAEMFQKIVPLIMQSKSASTVHNFISSESDILNKYGVSYEMVLRLGECGLLNTNESSLWHSVSNHQTAIICNNEKMIIMFNESNTTEEMILSALQSVGWKYIPPDEMPRTDSDVIAESMLRNALIRLNPEIAESP